MSNELMKFLSVIKEESKINTIGFYDIPKICKRYKIKRIPKKELIIRKIKDKGYKASETHFSGSGIRSNVPIKELIKVIKKN